MGERIVVSCRMNGEEASRPGSRYLERARALTQRAEALGATLASWSATALAFSFDVESLDEAIDLAGEAATGEAAGQATGQAKWAIAIARGEMEPLAETGGGRADLAWGDALVSAVVLSRAAWPGEVLVEATFPDVDALVTTGKRAARDGERIMRGVRIDPRQPWKKDAVESVTRLRTPALTARRDVRPLLARPGAVHVVRADPGHGGSRMLAEIARAVAPGPVLLVTPAGASVEPLGAARRAIIRALATRPFPYDPALAQPLDRFLAGGGASIDEAAAFIAGMLQAGDPPSSRAAHAASGPPGALLLDDASEIDAESLEACSHVIAWMESPFHVVVRIDATDQVPAALAALPRGKELELGPLDRAEGEALAKAATGGALSATAAQRVARRAAYVPLAIVEALALALGRADIAWIGDSATLRARASFAGRTAKAAYWIGKRAKATSPDEKGVLAVIALLGGEATRKAVKDTLQGVDEAIDVDAAVPSLIAKRWLVETQPGWMALPSRTHRDTIAELLDEAPRRAVHHAIAAMLEARSGDIACAEAAHHAVMAGEGEHGARLALRAARAAATTGLPSSANRLLTLARLADPKCEPLTRQQLFTSLPPSRPSNAPPSRAQRVPRSPAPPAMDPPTPPPPSPPAPSRSVPAVTDDAPTERVSAMNVAQAAALLAAADAKRDERDRRDDDHDSDYPTVIKMNPLDRATDRDRIPAYVPPPALPPERPSAPRAGPPSPPPPRLPPEEATLPRAIPRPPTPAATPRPAPVVRRSTAALPSVVPPRPGGKTASPPPPPVAPAEAGAVATRMVDLAKSALLEGDAAAVDRWTEGLRAAGDHDRVAERIGAIARLTRGEVGEAIRSLRTLRDVASEQPPSSRAQASLALGLALAAANRADEALLVGLEALARARESADARAAKACLAFLAKLYAREERAEAESLRAAATATA